MHVEYLERGGGQDVHTNADAGKLVKQHAVSMLGNACSW